MVEATTAVQPYKKSTIRDYFETILVGVILLRFAHIFVFQAFQIPTPSMVDNLLVGDHLFVNKFIFGVKGEGGGGLFPLREVRRGDVVVFRYPPNPDVDYVKRVIGLPGETIQIRDKKIYINGQLLDEPYVLFRDPSTFPADPGLPEQYRLRDQFGPYSIPEGRYFCMGDNRDESFDSRYWGTVPLELIKGKPFIVYWSFRSAQSGDGTPTSGERVRQLLEVVTHFFSRTRWDRMFFLVDSRFHYQERE